MFDWLRNYIEQFKELWGNLDRRAKIIIGIGVFSVFLALTFLILWSGNTEYQTLFSKLEPTDADAIVKRLEETNIPYRLEDNGQTIKVSADIVHKTRLQMAGEGLPSRGVVGFEIFDQSNFGTTDFERKVNYYRAISGELSRSIQAMDNVDYARVQITAPKESIFVEEEQPAEASVLLSLAPGYKIKASQVRAISNLVASSVQGLNTDKVTIVDTSGNLLTGMLEQESTLESQLTMNQFEIERQFADGLKQDLRMMLSRILGPDNYTVQVKAKLNFDKREIESKEYSPVIGDEGIARSVQEQNESYQGTASGAEGVPGTTSNIPQYQNVEDSESNTNYESSDSITNYEINEKIERHVYAPGEVERISVAVVVNDSLNVAEMDKIEEVVQTAIGYNNNRGDMVTVTNLAFDRSLEEEIARAQAVAAEAEKSKRYTYAGLIGFIFIILLVLFMVLRRSGQPVSEEEVVPGKAIDYVVDEDLEAQEEMAATEGLTEEEKKRQELRKAVAKTVSEQPEEVAQLLKSWLMED